MSYARRIAYNTIVQIFGRLATTITSLTMVSLLNAGLGAAGWGTYSIITTYVGFVAVLADLGINLRYLQEFSRTPEEGEAITARFLGFRLVTALILIFLAPLIALYIPRYAPLSSAIFIVSIAQFFLLINQIFVSIFQAHVSMDRAILTDFLGRLVILIGVFNLLRQGLGLYAVLWVMVLGNLVNMLASYVLARPFVRIRAAFVLKDWPALLRQVLPIAALSVLGLIHFKADSVILALEKPDVDVGIYGNAYKILEVLIVMPALFAGGLFPAMNQALKHKDKQFGQFIQKAFDLLLFAVAPVIMIIALLAPWIISILTRVNVLEASRSLQILCLALLPLFIGTLIAHALLAADQQKKLSMVELVAVVVNISLNLFLIPRFSYYGAASATFISEGLTVLMTLYLMWRTLHFVPSPYLLKSMLPLGGLVSLLLWWVMRILRDNYFVSFAGMSHFSQALITLLLFAFAALIYLLPFLLLGKLPPVVQERFNQFRKARA